MKRPSNGKVSPLSYLHCIHMDLQLARTPRVVLQVRDLDREEARSAVKRGENKSSKKLRAELRRAVKSSDQRLRMLGGYNVLK